MGARRGMPAEMKETWGDDIVYSESFCHREDVFYEGSENEDYENSATRRQRYEEAGQQFLSGSVPVLISATLRGPFDKSSGWANPWMSNRHRESSANRSQTSTDVEKVHIAKSRSSTRKPIREPKLQARTADCYLPSPESLKQAPYTQTHPYLEADEVDQVNQWRERVDPAQRTKDNFWVADKADCPTSTKKRRASGPEWLRKMSAKKRRPAATPTLSHNQVDDDEMDELMADMPPCSFEDMAPVSSPSKRRSPRNGLRRTSGKKLAESDDELSPNKGAAATLSSPVSLRNAHLVSSSMMKCQPSNYITSSAATQTTPSRLRYMNVVDIPIKFEIVKAPSSDGIGCGDAISDADAEDNEESVETMSEAPAVARSVEDTISDHDVNLADPAVDRDGDNEAVAAMDDVSRSPHHDQQLFRDANEVAIESEPQFDAHKVETDTEMQDPSTYQPESEPRCANRGSAEDMAPALSPSLTGENNDVGSVDHCMKEHSLLLPRTHSTRALNPEVVEEKAACETEREAEIKDELDSQMEVLDDSSESSTPSSSVVREDISLGCKEASYSQNNNNRSASAEITAAGGDIVYTDSLEQENSAPDKVSTPQTPTRVNTVGSTSEFSFRSIFNRLAPTSPWIGLARLASASQPPTENSAVKETTMSDDPHRNDEVDAKSGGANFDATGVVVSADAEQAPILEDNDIHDTLPNLDVDAASIDMVSSQEQTQLERPCSSGKSESLLNPPTEDDHRVSVSQQSPWIKTEHAVLSRAPLEMLSPNLLGVTPVGIPRNEANSILETRNPWAQNTHSNVHSSESSASNDENLEQAGYIKPLLPRPSTPEPQFCVKSFSSFISPSPDRRQKGRMSVPDSKSSSRHSQQYRSPTLKTRRSHHRSGLRVSWANSLVEVEGTSSQDQEASPCPHLSKRQGSPPPETSMNALPTTENTKFAKHFEAVASRREGKRQTLIPAESEQQLSPAHFAMAEIFMATDTNDKELELSNGENAETTETVACSRASEEPMDVVEDMVREMGGFWDTWNVDAELEQARKEPQVGTRPSFR